MAVAIKAGETDLSYPAVGLSDYTGMMDFATCSCQPVVTMVQDSQQVFAVPSCSAASERLLSATGCTAYVSQRRTALSPDTVATFCSCIR